MTVGGFNKTLHTGPAQSIPMTTSSGYYGVVLNGMRVDGHVVTKNFRSTIIDSGSTYTYMASEPYRLIRDSVVSYCKNHRNCGVKKLEGLKGKCWSMPGGVSGLDLFPTIESIF